MSKKRKPQNKREWMSFQQTFPAPFTSLPYNGTSGWSGTDTSKARAVDSDTSCVTGKRQASVLSLLKNAGTYGMTWKEIADATGMHHGTASGSLSALHKDGRIARLLESRDRSRIYVCLDSINGRDHDTQGRKAKACPNCGHDLTTKRGE